MKNLKNYGKTETSSDYKEFLTYLQYAPQKICIVLNSRKIGLQFSPFKIKELSLSDVEFELAILKMKKKIAQRSNPESRVEIWECEDPQGIYSYRIERRLIEQRRSLKASPTTTKPDRSKLDELCDKNGVLRHLGELYLSEIALGGECREKDQARLLGLLPF